MARSRFSAMASWSGSPGGRAWSSKEPASLNKAIRSTWPSVSRSSFKPRPKPHHFSGAEIVAQRVFDVVPTEVGVAVRVEKALFRCHQPALPIHYDRTTLEDDRRLIELVSVPNGEDRARILVAVPPPELPAPGVETKVDRRPPAPAVQAEDRPVVTDPRVVERDLDNVDPSRQRRTGLVAVQRARCHHGDGLEVGQDVRHRGVLDLCRRQFRAPQFPSARPSHKRPLVVGRLGRHLEPRGRWRPEGRRGRNTGRWHNARR